VVVPEPEQKPSNGDEQPEDWGYVPMSEWGDDFRR
jgi:hypothetical protein